MSRPTTGLRKKPTFEQIINYLEAGQEKIKYPNRYWSQLRNSPWLTQMDGEDQNDIEEQQLKQAQIVQRETIIREVAQQAGQSAQEVRVNEEHHHHNYNDNRSFTNNVINPVPGPPGPQGPPGGSGPQGPPGGSGHPLKKDTGTDPMDYIQSPPRGAPPPPPPHAGKVMITRSTSMMPTTAKEDVPMTSSSSSGSPPGPPPSAGRVKRTKFTLGPDEEYPDMFTQGRPPQPPPPGAGIKFHAMDRDDSVNSRAMDYQTDEWTAAQDVESSTRDKTTNGERSSFSAGPVRNGTPTSSSIRTTICRLGDKGLLGSTATNSQRKKSILRRAEKKRS